MHWLWKSGSTANASEKNADGDGPEAPCEESEVRAAFNAHPRWRHILSIYQCRSKCRQGEYWSNFRNIGSIGFRRILHLVLGIYIKPYLSS